MKARDIQNGGRLTFARVKSRKGERDGLELIYGRHLVGTYNMVQNPVADVFT